MDAKLETDSNTVGVAMENHESHRRRSHTADVIIKRYLFVTVLTCALFNCSSLVVSSVSGNFYIYYFNNRCFELSLGI